MDEAEFKQVQITKGEEGGAMECTVTVRPQAESGAVLSGGFYLQSDLRSLLGVDHADVFVVFQRMLSVLLLGTHVLPQQT